MAQCLLDDILKGYARGMFSYTHYITHTKYITNKDIIDTRIKIIQFAEKYGMDAATEAYSVSRATIYNWKKRIRPRYGAGVKGKTIFPHLDDLAPLSRRPKHLRQSKLDYWYEEQILALRKRYPELGKSKLKPMLDEICREGQREFISEFTIGRIVAKLKAKGLLQKTGKVTLYAKTGRIAKHHNAKPRLKKQRRGNYRPQNPGDLVQIDCVVKFINGIRRYIVSGIDYKSSFAYSYAYTHLSSEVSTDFLHKFEKVAPFTLKHIQTDNGSEFMARFHEDLERQGLTHFFNYPRHPKSNGKIERYNRTIQVECVDPNLDELAYDIDQFNYILTDWLIYYNTRRPHYSHRSPNDPHIQIPPMKALLYMLKLNEPESNMLWTHTNSRHIDQFDIK